MRSSRSRIQNAKRRHLGRSRSRGSSLLALTTQRAKVRSPRPAQRLCPIAVRRIRHRSRKPAADPRMRPHIAARICAGVRPVAIATEVVVFIAVPLQIIAGVAIASVLQPVGAAVEFLCHSRPLAFAACGADEAVGRLALRRCLGGGSSARTPANLPVRAGDWLGLRSTVPLKLGPDLREGRKRAGVVQREPNHIRFQPAAPMW